MNIVNWIDLLAAAAGLIVATIVALFPRFGPTSWNLALFLFLGALSAGVLGIAPLLPFSAAFSVVLSFQVLILSGAVGSLSSYSFGREDCLKQFRSNRLFFVAIGTATPVLVAALHLYRPAVTGPSELVPLGPVGYGSALYLLLLSVVALANVEQTLRSIEEHVRWEIKFLWLGIGSSFGALVYVASQILIYPAENPYLPVKAMRIFPIIFFCSSLLILQSWKRATARGQMVVSEGVIYGTITLVSVGGYLVAASLVSGWASRLGETGVPAEAIVFLLSLVMLSTLFLATAFRHRARFWIRRHLLAGRYDYRQFWLTATEEIRANESIELAGAALVKLIQSAAGSIDVSVWVTARNSGNLRLVAAKGSIATQLPGEIAGMNDQLATVKKPIAVTDAAARLLTERNADFVSTTKASVIVPLISSGRLVGLMTVGADRSGKQFDWQTIEFLGVMAVHFANEFHKAELLSTLVETREAEAFQTFSTFLLHDLKNFATTLSLIAKNAARHHGNPDFQADAFDSILRLSEKMKRLCGNLRTFSTTLAANKILDDVNQIVSSVAQTFEATVGRRLLLDLGSVPPVFVDREEIVRVLQNLVLNAHEASPENATIDLKTRCESQTVLITVADHGHGMSTQFLNKALFQPFQTTKSDGVGIGLFQSKKIIEAHAGKIEVDSVLGKGTAIRIILPMPDSADFSTTVSVQETNPSANAIDTRLNSSEAPVSSYFG